jgi:hypothetical protein
MRCRVLATDVGLDLDDAALAPAARFVADQPGAQDRAGDVERRPGQRRAVEDAQLPVL